jgi:hypothetical protein
MIFGSRNFSFGSAWVQQMLRRSLILPNSATEHRQTLASLPTETFFKKYLHLYNKAKKRGVSIVNLPDTLTPSAYGGFRL